MRGDISTDRNHLRKKRKHIELNCCFADKTPTYQIHQNSNCGGVESVHSSRFHRGTWHEWLNALFLMPTFFAPQKSLRFRRVLRQKLNLALFI